jgi:glc operon protein GlcG
VALSLAEAISVVDAAIAKARELNITVSVAVCDNLGHLIALNRMNGAYGEANRFAIGKAIVSSSTGVPSGEVQGQVDHPPGAYVVAQGVPAIRVRGGLPIFRNGQIEGACGVGGGSSREQEEECARAGIASIRQ